MSGPKVLFITRKYPPSVGGMETLAEAVHEALGRVSSPGLVALGRSQRNLVWFLPWAAVRMALFLLTGRTQLVLFGDALVFAALRPFLWNRRVTALVMVMGLDLTFPHPWYRTWVKWALRRADRVVAISRATREQATELGVPIERILVINPGLAVPMHDIDRDLVRRKLCERLGLDGTSFLVLTLGRLVARKGIDWFVTEVLPKLPRHVHYLVAGSGPEEDQIRSAGYRAGVEGRFYMLGSVDERLREELLIGSDVFVIPNVPIDGDMEGFGLVAVESALRGTPVVASRLEGLQDAVVQGKTGYMCVPLDANDFAARIADLARQAPVDMERLRDRTARSARERYSLGRMAADLEALMNTSHR